jgi:ceramide glucosyltransferase
MTPLADVTAFFSVIGLVQASIALGELNRFRCRPRLRVQIRPPVSILKPLKGDEPLLEQALASFCSQNYPNYQIIFGVQDPDDPAITLVEKLKWHFPSQDITLIVDDTEHSGNRKIGNLLNMWPAAKHDIIVLADSDVHVAPDFLERILPPLEEAGVGLVTALYTGFPSGRGLVGILGAAQINHIFLSGVLLGRRLGRQDCLGAATAFRRNTLDQIGGLQALLPHLADDAALGRYTRRLGQRVALMPGLVRTTVTEETFGALFCHELRWARTIRALEPFTYATTILQLPVLWALVAFPASGFAWWSVGFAGFAWVWRGVILRGTIRELGCGWFSTWLIPIREILSLVILIASYSGDQVVWRGSSMTAVTNWPQINARSRWLNFSKVFFAADATLPASRNPLRWLRPRLTHLAHLQREMAKRLFDVI